MHSLTPASPPPTQPAAGPCSVGSGRWVHVMPRLAAHTSMTFNEVRVIVHSQIANMPHRHDRHGRNQPDRRAPGYTGQAATNADRPMSLPPALSGATALRVSAACETWSKIQNAVSVL